MSTTSGPAGWYPQADGTQRYWDGRAWTPQVAPGLPAYHGVFGGAPLYPQDGQPWPPIPTSPGRYSVGPAPGQPIAYGSPPVYAPRSPGLALVASFLVPGLGQFINGEIGKGLVFLIAYLVAIISVVLIVGFLLVPALWIWAMVDAYRSAKTWNLAHGILS